MHDTYKTLSSDVLVIGGGAAGSLAAIRARELGADVLLVDKSVFGRSGCAALASGAFHVYFPGDDVTDFIRGYGDLVDQRLSAKLVRATFEVFQHLEEWGVPFVKENGKIRRDQAAASGHTAGLLGGGPAMMLAVKRHALEIGVRVLNRTMITDLLTSDGRLPTKGEVVGAIGVGVRDGQVTVFKAKTVIICTGGIIFPYPKLGEPFGSMPIDLSGDGIASEIRAGAVMGNLAIGGMSIHPTEFHAARGLEHFSIQGAKWTNRLGEDVLEKYKDAEKVTGRRRTLNAAMAVEVREGRGPVSLDIRHFTPDQFRFLRDVIPIIMGNYEGAGYDLSHEIVPYVSEVGLQSFTFPAGAVIDEECRTSIKRLYAAGNSSDAMRTGMSRAVPDCCVLGWWAGKHATKFALGAKFGKIVEEQVDDLEKKIVASLALKKGIDYQKAHDILAKIFIENGSIFNVRKLQKALEKFEGFARNDSSRIIAKDPHYLAKVLGLRNVADVEVLVIRYLLYRKESRGSVINEDYPETDNENWLNWTRARLGEDGKFEFWDEVIPDKAYAFRKPSKGKRRHPILEILKQHG